MYNHIMRYATTLLVLGGIDFVWLSIMVSRFYKPYLAHLIAADFVMAPVFLFYPLYAWALSVLVITPAVLHGYTIAYTGYLGALLGLAAYGAYNLTNHAMLRDWPIMVTYIDIVWGTCMTAVSAMVVVALLRAYHI